MILLVRTTTDMTISIILYIYIYIDLPNFVNVTMYCCRHVIQMLFHCVYSCTYIMWHNQTDVSLRQCHTCPALKDIIQGNRFWPQTRGCMYTCLLDQVTLVSLALLRYTDRKYTVPIFSLYYTILYAVLRLYYLYKNFMNIVT